MPGKRVQFDDETWATVDLLARDREASFQELADEAFADLFKKYRRIPNFRMALKESAKHPQERAHGKQRTDRRQPTHRGRKKAHAA
jgi:hypothetical protein